MRFAKRRLTVLLMALVAACGAWVGVAVATPSEQPEPVALQQEFDQLRGERLVGLMKIEAAIRRWGTEADAQDLAEVQAEIEALGGPDPAKQAEIEAELDRFLTPQEAAAIANER